MKTNIFFKRNSKPKTGATRKFIFHVLSRTLPLCLVLLISGNVWGQAYYNMSSGNYSQNFADMANWTNNYAAGIGASNWKVAVTATGSSVNTGTVFVSSTTGGVQKGTQSLIILATGTNSSATDLLLNFSGRTAGTISLDWEKVVNSANTSPRSSDLKIQYSTDGGSNFTDITGYTIPRIFNSSTAESGSLSSITLPAALNNQSTVVLRFFVWNNGQTGGSGNRPKWQIDNISVTSTATATNYTVTFDPNSGSGTMSNQTSSSTTTLTSNTFTRTGYTFAGWNTAANGSGTSYANGASFPFSTNTTLYAQWTANTLNVTYDLQGGAGVSNGTTTTGASLSNPGSPTRSGYNFEGWFTASNGGAPITFPYTHGQTSNFTLYAQWTLASSNNCPNGASISPTTDQEVCENGTLNLITATPSYSGGTGTPTVQNQWYYNTTNSNTISGATVVSGATNASLTPLSSSNEVGTRYYFCVAYATDNSCAQTATTQSLASNTVKVVVKGIPAAPTGTASQSMCSGQTVSNLNATGSSIRWYNASSAGTAWSSSSALSSTNYYASQTVNGCESSNRLAVAVTVNAIPSAPSGNASQTFCSGQTVSYLSATGTGIQWYSGSSGGSPLITSSALSSTNYYASQTVNGCESSNRFQVAATVNTISTPTNIVVSNANCSSFDLAWNAVNCASGYKLDMSDLLSFSKKSNATDLFISEYIEGSSNNKYIEIYNGTGSSIDLSNYQLLLFPNGSSTASTTTLSGTLNNNSVIVYKNSSAAIYSGLSTTNNSVNYSGDDAIALYKISTSSYVDIFGRIGEDPGTSWTNGTFSTVDKTLVRKSNIISGVTVNPSSGFPTLATEWDVFNIDNVSNLGTHNYNASSPNFIPNYNDKTIASNSTSISGLSPNTKYYYRVRSTDGTNTSPNSNVDSITTPALVLTTDGIIAPFCFGTATSSSLTYTAANDNPNSYSIDWNSAANTAGLTDQTATSFTSSTSGGTISSIAIPSNIVAGTYNGVMTITNAAGCSITKNVSLTINALPTITIAATPANAFVCQGSSVTLTATAGLSSYTWSSGASTTNTATFSPTATNTYSVTGTDGNGCINSASQTVNYYPASSYVGLSTSNVSGAVEQCTESNGWTYYALPSNPSQYLFGIYKNGNTFTATVDITLDNINKHRKSTSSNGANQEHASYIMSRYWNATLSSGSIASNSSVKVRFFIDPQDITDLLDERDDDYNVLKNTTNTNTFAVKSGFEWFKTVGTVYAPTNWLGNTHNGTIVKLMEDTVGTLNGQTYVELSGITSFSGGSGGAAFGPTSNGLFNNGGVVGLPVTWNKVDVQTLENGNEVVWSTSSEQNTSHFEVEYSDDAVQFYKVSENIPAAGNSSTTQYYKFLHESEMKPWLYYRVKQVDLDGKVDYSKIVIAKRTSKLPDFKVLIYPIPLIEGDLTLDIHSIAQTEIQIRVIDLLGKEVYREKVPSKGYRTQHQLQLNHLPKGQYQIQIDNSIFSHQQRLVLMK